METRSSTQREATFRFGKLGNELQLKNIALTFVPSFSDKSSEIYLNRVNPNIENTFIVYRRSNIIGKFTNLKPTEENFAKIQQQLDQTDNEYFKLPRAKSNKSSVQQW